MQAVRNGFERFDHAHRTASRPLAGRRVLLVEDEALVAIDLEMTLKAAGAVVVGPFLRLAPALKAAAGESFDVAILDVVLGREKSYPLADLLAERGVPLVFHSGHLLVGGMAERYSGVLCCRKPCSPETLVRTVARAVSG